MSGERVVSRKVGDGPWVDVGEKRTHQRYAQRYGGVVAYLAGQHLHNEVAIRAGALALGVDANRLALDITEYRNQKAQR